MKRFIACVFLGLSASVAVAAEPCSDNFTATGSVFIGKTYRTFAIVKGVPQADMFQRARAFTAANGFTITSSDQEAGLISAEQTASRAQGEIIPFGIVILQESEGLRISLNLDTTKTTATPDDAVKRHFCMTIGAAISGAPATVTVVPAAPAAPAPEKRP